MILGIGLDKKIDYKWEKECLDNGKIGVQQEAPWGMEAHNAQRIIFRLGS